MIGQKNLLATIDKLIENGTFPRFCILVGPRGCGKRTLCRLLATKLKAYYYTCGTGVDDIRQMIDEAYKISDTILYIISGADKMSVAAKNALLKVTEEPPRNAYFVMTLEDSNNTLNTIRSRGTIFNMDAYTPDEIHDYALEHYVGEIYAEEADIIMNLCETPFEVILLYDAGIKEFWDYVNLVVDNIAEVSGANSFKIGDKICFKDAEKGKFDLKLFWKAFMTVCSQRLTQDPIRYAHGVTITSKYLQELRVTGINKQSTFDMWLLDIREGWM